MKYRVWHIMNLDNEGIGKHDFEFFVESPKEGARLINALADVELEFPERVLGSNVFGMEELVDEEWLEWENEDSENIEAMADAMREE